MLDEFQGQAPAGFPDHPHRGFETVSALYILISVCTLELNKVSISRCYVLLNKIVWILFRLCYFKIFRFVLCFFKMIELYRDSETRYCAIVSKST